MPFCLSALSSSFIAAHQFRSDVAYSNEDGSQLVEMELVMFLCLCASLLYEETLIKGYLTLEVFIVAEVDEHEFLDESADPM